MVTISLNDLLLIIFVIMGISVLLGGLLGCSICSKSSKAPQGRYREISSDDNFPDNATSRKRKFRSRTDRSRKHFYSTEYDNPETFADTDNGHYETGVFDDSSTGFTHRHRHKSRRIFHNRAKTRRKARIRHDFDVIE